jgi:Protein of unknown function (DUF1761)
MGPINWLAVLLAAVSAFAVGMAWYGFAFGKAWKAELGLDGNTPHKLGMGTLMGGNLALLLVSAFMLGHMFARSPDLKPFLYYMMAGGVAAFFVVPALWTNYLYQQRTLKLALIDGGYWIVAFLCMGGVFRAFA